MVEEKMAIPVQETTQTTCPPPSTAAFIANLEYLEDPLLTAASVASEWSAHLYQTALHHSGVLLV